MDYLDYITDKETFEIYIAAGDGVTYDRQKVVLNVGAQPDFADAGIPSCGTSQNVTGRVDNLESVDNFKVVSYIFISGSVQARDGG